MNKQLKEIILNQIKPGLNNQLSALAIHSMEDQMIDTYINALIDKLYDRLKERANTDQYTDKNWFQTGFYMAIESLGAEV